MIYTKINMRLDWCVFTLIHILVSGSTGTTYASSTTSFSQPTSPTTAVYVLPQERRPLSAQQDDGEEDHESTVHTGGSDVFVVNNSVSQLSEPTAVQ